jgi:thiol-disulfide isomerase/thioredoxin
MTRILLAAVLIGVALIGLSSAQAQVREGAEAPALTKLTNAAGEELPPPRWPGRVVVVTFGASWCEPCKKELPALERLAVRYHAAKAKVLFIAINVDLDRKKGKEFVAAVGLLRVRVAYDVHQSSVEAYDPPKMPSVFIITKGVVTHVHAGYEKGDDKKLAKVIDRELAKL